MWAALFFSLVVIFFLCGIWIGGFFFGLSMAVKVVLTLVVFGFVLIMLSINFIMRMRAGARLEKAMVAGSGGPPPAPGAPDRRREVTALQQQMAKSIAALKTSRLGGGGRTALYALPWYAIIGPPGAGKTTAIRHSSLEFPFEQSGGASPMRGTSGTRNCDWWFTNEAILLDTAGRYSEGADDQQEWLSFLDLLRKNRPRKPLNGLIVALSITDLATAGPAEIEAIGKRLRARIDEITLRLKLRVPVYVLFTKTDMVAGFAEFWADLRKSERGQMWGMGFAVDEPLEPGPRFEREFETLVQTLRARTVRRLQSERHLATRHALWGFPLEFGALQANLTNFVSVLFRPNSFQETPIFRGVYFSSGTQNARPLSRVLAAMSQQFGLKLPNVVGEPTTPASFFLTDVFRKVMFRDSSLALVTEGEARRSLLVRMAVGSFAVMVASSVLFPALITFSHNRDLLKRTVGITSAIQATDWADSSKLDKTVQKLDEAARELNEFAAWQDPDAGVPVTYRWGMYSGEEMRAGLRDVYATAVTKQVIQPTKKDLEDKLRAIDSGPSRTTENFNRDYDNLKLYLMLSDPAHMDPTWAARRIAREWTLTAHARVDGEENLVLPHLVQVFELLKRGELPPWEKDPGLILRARTTLQQVPQIDRMYESLVRDANTEVAAIRRASIFYKAVAPFILSRHDVKVDGAYTKQGWSMVKGLLGQQKEKLASEQWVLGDGKNDVNPKEVTDKLRDLYFERYQMAWRAFINDFSVQDPGNSEVAIEELTALSEPEWPYLRLIRTLNDNVTLDVDDATDVKAVGDKLIEQGKALAAGTETREEAARKLAKRTISPVEKAFSPILKFGVPPATESANAPPTGLAQYEALLSKLVGALTDLRDADQGADPRKMNDVFQDAFRTTSALLSDQDGFTRPLISPLLMNPITLAWSKVVRDAGSAAGASWESNVWQKWHDKLEGRYPFTNSPNDANLDDVMDFFAPGEGLLWSFYDEALKATIDRNGGNFQAARRFRSGIGYSSEFLDGCLKRGHEFTTVLFPPHHDKAEVSFDVNLHSVSPNISQVIWEVDGVSHSYRNEPEQWVTVKWPGKAPRGARLRVKGSSGLDEEIARPGDFGLLRLLDDATLKSGRAGGTADGTPTILAVWELKGAHDGATVTLDLRPSRNENPLSSGFFRGYTCPRTITTK